MKDILSDPAVIAAASSCLVSLFGLLAALFLYLRQRLSTKKAQAYAEKSNTDLLAENAKLKSVVIQGYLDSLKKEDKHEETK